MHRTYFHADGLRYPMVFQLHYTAEQCEVLQLMPLRPREIVAFWDFTHELPQGPDEGVLDLAQPLDRMPHCVNAVPCVLPNAMLWLRRNFRFLEPCEAFCKRCRC